MQTFKHSFKISLPASSLLEGFSVVGHRFSERHSPLLLLTVWMRGRRMGGGETRRQKPLRIFSKPQTLDEKCCRQGFTYINTNWKLKKSIYILSTSVRKWDSLRGYYGPKQILRYKRSPNLPLAQVIDDIQMWLHATSYWQQLREVCYLESIFF